MPELADLADLNRMLLAGCEADLSRRIDGRQHTIREAWTAERPRLLALPADRFDCCETATPRVDAKSLVTVRQNRYSVPVALAGLRVSARIGAREITINHGGCEVARHERLHGKFGTSAQLDHYLELPLWGPRDPWWRAEPLRLRAVERDGPPVWDVGARVLTVPLPKAARVDVQVSSLPDESHLSQHGVWRALRALVTDRDSAAALLQLSRTGRTWALCPARRVTLVHAVQHPLETPDVLALRAVRAAGATATELSGEIRIHGGSTDRIDVDAAWEEWVDLPGGAQEQPPQRVPRTGAALTTQIHLARDTAAEPIEVGRPATARYVEADDLVLLGVGPASDSTPGFVTSHELHDTRHRRIAYSAVATSRFREYFRPELVAPDGAPTRRAAPVSVDVPSSAAPPPPRLVYAMPMFGWERATADRTRTSRRRGGGLRLFLGRPWYASGDGDLLGAVLWPGTLGKIGSCQIAVSLHAVSVRGTVPLGFRLYLAAPVTAESVGRGP